MPRLAIFVLIASKLARAESEIANLDSYLANYRTSGFEDAWSRTATIAFTVHGVYTAMEDIMSDIANEIDSHVPTGGASHQALLDQMHVSLEDRRAAVLDDKLYTKMIEIKAFRHLVRHQYGVSLLPDRTEAMLDTTRAAFSAFASSIARLEERLSRPT